MQAQRGETVGEGLPRKAVPAAIAIGVIALDQLTKWAVASLLGEGESRPLIDGVLRLSHIRNTGAAFGILRGWGGLFALAAIVGVIVFAAVVIREPDLWTSVAAALVAAGAAGNLIDRIFREGGVVDFVDFGFWPAFNVADSAITVGAILLIWTGFKREDVRARSRD